MPTTYPTDAEGRSQLARRQWLVLMFINFLSRSMRGMAVTLRTHACLFACWVAVFFLVGWLVRHCLQCRSAAADEWQLRSYGRMGSCCRLRGLTAPSAAWVREWESSGTVVPGSNCRLGTVRYRRSSYWLRVDAAAALCFVHARPSGWAHSWRAHMHQQPTKHGSSPGIVNKFFLMHNGCDRLLAKRGGSESAVLAGQGCWEPFVAMACYCATLSLSLVVSLKQNMKKYICCFLRSIDGLGISNGRSATAGGTTPYTTFASGHAILYLVASKKRTHARFCNHSYDEPPETG